MSDVTTAMDAIIDHLRAALNETQPQQPDEAMTDQTLIASDTYVTLARNDGAVLHYGPFAEGESALLIHVECMSKHGEVTTRRGLTVQELADLGIAR